MTPDDATPLSMLAAQEAGRAPDVHASLGGLAQTAGAVQRWAVLAAEDRAYRVAYEQAMRSIAQCRSYLNRVEDALSREPLRAPALGEMRLVGTDEPVPLHARLRAVMQTASPPEPPKAA